MTIHIVSRCTSRLNFLGDVEKLIMVFKEPMMLYNLNRYLHHVGRCNDPTCGTVICIDGNEKVCRRICGEPLDPPSEDTGYDPTASDVHNVVSRAIMREKVCPNAPKGRGKGACKVCVERAMTRQAMPVPVEITSPRQTRSCTNMQPDPEDTTNKCSEGIEGAKKVSSVPCTRS
jgi:hypothetical protein